MSQGLPSEDRTPLASTYLDGYHSLDSTLGEDSSTHDLSTQERLEKLKHRLAELQEARKLAEHHLSELTSSKTNSNESLSTRAHCEPDEMIRRSSKIKYVGQISEYGQQFCTEPSHTEHCEIRSYEIAIDAANWIILIERHSRETKPRIRTFPTTPLSMRPPNQHHYTCPRFEANLYELVKDYTDQETSTLPEFLLFLRRLCIASFSDE